MNASPRPFRATGLPVLAAALALSTAGTAAQPTDPAPLQASIELGGERLPRLGDTLADTRIEAVGWSQRDGHGLGVAVGATFHPGAADRPNDPMRSTVGVGLRWRSPLGERQRLDVAAWRALAENERDPATLTTRIEMQFTSPQRAVAERGALGLQLSSESRVSMRLRKGGPMLYYRTRF